MVVVPRLDGDDGGAAQRAVGLGGDDEAAGVGDDGAGGGREGDGQRGFVAHCAGGAEEGGVFSGEGGHPGLELVGGFVLFQDVVAEAGGLD